MAVVRISGEHKVLRDPDVVAERLAIVGIDYERWKLSQTLVPDAQPAQILEAYASEIERLKTAGGYVTADVIDVTPQTPGLDAMLAKFNCEHYHAEDEVRFILRGRGLFHVRPAAGPVLAIEVEAADLIRVPKGMRHWFHLCAEREIRAIRLFQDPAGWTPYYTESGGEQHYQPVCLGTAHIPLSAAPN